MLGNIDDALGGEDVDDSQNAILCSLLDLVQEPTLLSKSHQLGKSSVTVTHIVLLNTMGQWDIGFCQVCLRNVPGQTLVTGRTPLKRGWRRERGTLADRAHSEHTGGWLVHFLIFLFSLLPLCRLS